MISEVLTSSIASVEAEELDMIGSLSVDQMLEGKATGLMITNQSSTPGAAAKVRIRGGSTFTGNQSPLWVNRWSHLRRSGSPFGG